MVVASTMTSTQEDWPLSREAHEDEDANAATILPKPTHLATEAQPRPDHTEPPFELEEKVRLRREALAQEPASHPNRTKSLNALATALHACFRESGRRAELDEAASLYREALALHKTASSGRSLLLSSLAEALHDRFELTCDFQDLDNAIGLHREALTLDPGIHWDRSHSLNDLAMSLHTRFTRTGHLSDLDEAVSLHREALTLSPGTSSTRSAFLSTLAEALHTRYDQTDEDTDIEEVVVLHRQALAMRPLPHKGRVTSLSNLGSALRTRFGRTGQLSDLDEAVSLHREALAAVPTNHPIPASLFTGLAMTLQIRFKHTGHQYDLDQAVLLNREAVALLGKSHPSRPNSLHGLASILQAQFQQTGQLSDLDEAILLHREVLDLLPAHHLERSTSLNNLAIALQDRFQQTNQRSDLDESVALHRDSLALRPEPHGARYQSLSNLAAALHLRFEETGQISDLDETVSLHREALTLRQPSDPDRPIILNNLAVALQTRFKGTRQRPDLDEAILLYNEILLLQDKHHPGRPTSLHNLATAIRTRYNQTDQLLDLNEAVSLHHEALDLYPATHPERSTLLGNLAAVLHLRFEKTKQHSDLDETISLHREALSLRPAPHPDRATSLHNLALALRTRCHSTGKLSDLNEAIELSLSAFQTLPPEHPSICSTLRTYGELLINRIDMTGVLEDSIEQQVEDMMKAVNAYRTAADSGSAPVSERFAAARSWASLSDVSEPLSGSGLEAYQTAIGFLPRLAAVGLDLESRQRGLTLDTDGLAREAAAFAIQSERFDKAIELLEAGRAVFWSQALQLRTPLEELESVEPALAQRLRAISRALEQGALRDVSRSMSDPAEKVVSMEQEAIRFRQLNTEWLLTVKEVQNLDGFHDFLLPKSFSSLSAAAANGPVVILNSSELRSSCDALIIRHNQDPVHVPLKTITLKAVKELLRKLRALQDASVPLVREDSDRHIHQIHPDTVDPHAVFRDLLGTLWKTVVKPILYSLDLKASSSPSRLWWLPTGPFASLPIHAAGLYDVPGGECVSDYVVSSYTPTLSTLLTSLPNTVSPFKMLVTIDQVRLKHTAAELQKIEQHVPSDCLVKLGIPGVPACVKSVLSDLPAASIVHLACHGVQDAKNPLNSALLLEDDRLKVSQLIPLSMPNASLVFLNACQTAMVDEDIPDEPIHLAATLLFSGFRRAIATMWAIKDRDGPVIADAFYRSLFSTGKFPSVGGHPSAAPDTTHAARALHLAVNELRATLDAQKDSSQFLRWVPFVHFGL